MLSSTRVVIVTLGFLVAAAECNSVVLLPEFLYLNVTHSRLELFVAQHQRQYAANTKLMEEQLRDFKAIYTNRLDVISLQSELLETKFNEIDNRLVPLELLDDVSSYCVQRYRGKLPAFATYKTNMATCMQKGTSMVASIAAAPETTLRNLNSYYLNQFATSLKTCKNKPKIVEKDLAACISAAVTAASLVASTNTATFLNQLKAADCTANTKVKEVSDCYSAVIAGGFMLLGEVTSLVENCIAGHEFCPSCGDDDKAVIGRCPFHLAWHLAPDDLKSAKIDNPFKGLTDTTPCLQINFIANSTKITLV